MRTMRARKTDGAMGTLYTIGHSTRTTREFVDLLRAHGVEQVVDVRTIPKSRHNPQFNRPALSRALHAVKVGYRHVKALGGLRHARPDSVNLGWRNASFRGYADYMQSEDFVAGLEHLEQLAARRPTAIMCAEAVPWRCHRSLIADALTVAGWRVLHIQSRHTARPHKRTNFLRVRSGKLLYPATEEAPRLDAASVSRAARRHAPRGQTAPRHGAHTVREGDGQRSASPGAAWSSRPAGNRCPDAPEAAVAMWRRPVAV
jgi:hypothetical protein